MISLRGIAHNHFCHEATQKELHTNDHSSQGDVECGTVREGEIRRTQLSDDQVDYSDEAGKEEQGAEQSEELHGAFTEFTEKHDGAQIEEAVHKTLPAEFGATIFPRTVFYYFFSNLSKATPFGEDGNIAVHFTKYFDAFHNAVVICFQSAIKIMQMNTGVGTGNGVE